MGVIYLSALHCHSQYTWISEKTQNLNRTIQRTSKAANRISLSCHNSFPNHLYTLHKLDAYKLVRFFFFFFDHVYWSEMCAEREFSTSFQLPCSHDTSFCNLVHYTKRPVILGNFCVLRVWTTRYTHITKHCVHLYIKPPTCFTSRTTMWIFIEFDTGR